MDRKQRRRIGLVSWLHRFVALGAAAVVFALTVFAASPAAHECLHADHTPAAEDTCAVALFQGGVTPILATTLVTATVVWAEGKSIVPERVVALPSPRYLLQPERGPPGLG